MPAGRVTIALSTVLAFASACGDDDDAGRTPVEAEESAFQDVVAEADERLLVLVSYSYRTSLEVELPQAGGELGATTASTVVDGEAVPPVDFHQVATSTVGTISAEEELTRVAAGDFVRRGDEQRPGLGELSTGLLSVPSLWAEVGGVAGLFPPDPENEDEIVEGVESIHYLCEDVRLLFVKNLVLRLYGAVESAAALPERYSVDLWVSKDAGVLLKLVVEGSREDPRGGQVKFRLESSINDIGGDVDIRLE